MSTDPFFEIIASEAPAPLLHRLRAEAPVHRVEPLGFWLATRHDDVMSLFHDPHRVSPDKRLWNDYVPAPEGSMIRWSDDHSLFAMSKADHARIRRLVSAAFTPRAVRRMDAQIREVIEHVAAPLRGRHGEVVDALGEFTEIVPNAVISRITGIAPGDDESRFRRIAQSMIASFMPFTPPALRDEAEASFRELAGWVRELVAKRRAHPEEDLVTDLVQTQGADDRLDENDIVLLLTGIVGAGTETTALAGAGMLKMLLRDAEATARLRGDRPLVHRAIDEIIRYTFDGAGGPMRFAVRDFELRGRSIRRGEMVMLSIGAANHDPAVFPDPERLDLDRDVRELATFGSGPHYCLGANLARRELACMLDALLDVFPPGSHVRDDLSETQDSGLFRRTLNMPVQVGQAD